MAPRIPHKVWNARWSKDEWAAYHQANKTGQENDEPSGGSASTLGAGKGKGVGGASSSEAAATQVASSTMLECSETREGVEQGSPERAAKRRRSPA